MSREGARSRTVLGTVIALAFSTTLTAKKAPVEPPRPVGRVLFEVDSACVLYVGDQRILETKDDATIGADVAPGSYRGIALSSDGVRRVERDFTVEDGGLTIVALRLAEAGTDLADACAVSINPAGDENRSGPVKDACLLRPRQEGDIEPPKLVHKVEPAYPASLRNRGIAGEVVLECIIDVNGRVQANKVLRTAAQELVEPSVIAASAWTYEPAKLNGLPQAVYLVVRVKYSLG